MLSSNIILGVRNKDFFAEDCKLFSAILTQNYDHLPCGTPMIAAVRKQGASVACINAFPARANNGSGIMWLPRNVLKFVERRPLCETHKVKSIEAFDYSKFSTVIKSVREYGGISFVANKKAAALSILDAIKLIIKEYKYHSLFQYNTYDNRFLSGKDDDLLSVLSFFDFIHCVPMFNLKKADGMGISFSQVIRKRSELEEKQIQTFRVDIVVSNHEDNLFIIDGAVIDQKYIIENSLYKKIKLRINTDLSISNDKLKLKKIRAAPMKGAYIKFDEPERFSDRPVEVIQGPEVASYAYSKFKTSTSTSTTNY